MTKSGDRTAHWPAIEKKHGQPMEYWFGVMAELKARHGASLDMSRTSGWVKESLS